MRKILVKAIESLFSLKDTYLKTLKELLNEFQSEFINKKFIAHSYQILVDSDLHNIFFFLHIFF